MGGDQIGGCKMETVVTGGNLRVKHQAEMAIAKMGSLIRGGRFTGRCGISLEIVHNTIN